jgi:subtilase-type serine protease
LIQVWSAKWQRRRRRHHRDAALEAGIEPYWLAVANVRQPNAANGETDYVINAARASALPPTGASPHPARQSSAPSFPVTSRDAGEDRRLRPALIDSQNPTYDYGQKTGTSMAAPISPAHSAC